MRRRGDVISAAADPAPRAVARGARGPRENEDAPAPRSTDALAILGHELRVPLAAITGGLTALEGLSQLPPEAGPWCALIRRNLGVIEQLVEDVLDASRAERGVLSVRPQEVVDVHAVLTQVEEMFARASGPGGPALRLQLGASRHQVRGHALRLAQVFWNLIGNGLKFTPAGGEVVVQTSSRGMVLTVEVRDTGVGLKADELERIWRPFVQGARETSDPHSLGLGLYLCKSLVERLGGRITVDSAGEDKGARFLVDLPAVSAAPRRKTAGVVAAAGRTTLPVRILLVDDHADTVEALSLLLRQRGYHVRAAGSVQAALAEAKRKPAPDLVISDLALPDGNGLDLMRLLRRMRPVRGIAVSGFGGQRDVAAAKRAGFVRHLTKPVVPAALVQAIDEVVREPLPRD